MKSRTLIFGLIVLASTIIITNGSCSSSDGGDSDTTTVADSSKMPLNVVVFLDLSDRVTKNSDGTTQLDKDISIVNHLATIVSEKAYKNNIRKAKDCFKVIFYPAPEDSTINDLAKKLDIDMSSYQKIELQKKMDDVHNLSKTVNDNLKVIYDNTIEQHNFVGCDIWGFFNTKAKNYCVKPEYRNILVLITDGYIYHKDNLLKNQDNQTTYITPKSLSQNCDLIPGSDNLSDLEILMLEVNADPITDFTKIKQTVTTWFKAMGAKKYNIVETDLPNNTKTIVDNFLNIH